MAILTATERANMVEAVGDYLSDHYKSFNEEDREVAASKLATDFVKLDEMSFLLADKDKSVPLMH